MLPVARRIGAVVMTPFLKAILIISSQTNYDVRVVMVLHAAPLL